MLTKSGLAAVIAAAACAAAGLWWHYEELMVIAVAAGVAVGGALWSSRVRHAARIQRTISAPRVARGDPIRTVYRAVNRSHHRSPSAWIVDSCDGATIRVALPAIGKDAFQPVEAGCAGHGPAAAGVLGEPAPRRSDGHLHRNRIHG